MADYKHEILKGICASFEFVIIHSDGTEINCPIGHNTNIKQIASNVLKCQMSELAIHDYPIVVHGTLHVVYYIRSRREEETMIESDEEDCIDQSLSTNKHSALEGRVIGHAIAFPSDVVSVCKYERMGESLKKILDSVKEVLGEERIEEIMSRTTPMSEHPAKKKRR
jgi:hypothetical protein